MATYSSFFSSGLLAPPVTIYSRKDLNVGFDDEDMVGASPRRVDLSPAAPSSPMPIPVDSDIETEFNAIDRASTPTPEPLSRTLSSENMSMLTDYELPSIKGGMGMTGDGFVHVNAVSINGSAGAAGSATGAYSTSRSPSQPPSGRRLRRRRSSLASASSPVSAIKSPLINASQALELQRHLHKSPLRARSSSVSLSAAATGVMAGFSNRSVSGENTFMGRLRSGSVNGYKRRPLRRASMMPPAPPPTAPLPELPASLADTPVCEFLPAIKSAFPALSRSSLVLKSVTSPNMDDSAPPTMYRRGRDRSYSVTMHPRIDEEMKEN